MNEAGVEADGVESKQKRRIWSGDLARDGILS